MANKTAAYMSENLLESVAEDAKTVKKGNIGTRDAMGMLNLPNSADSYYAANKYIEALAMINNLSELHENL